MTADILYGDFEARSGADLRAAGSWAWIADPTTEVLVFSFQLRGVMHTWHPGEPCPPEIIEHAAEGGTFSGWNAGRFERLMWRHIMVPQFGWPELRDEQWRDPAARSRAVGLPGGLDNAAVALGLPVRKDKAGKDNMLHMARPLKGRYFAVDAPQFDEEELRHFLLDSYNAQDVRVEVAADAALPPLPKGERDIELLDWRINDRGIAVDLALVDALNTVTRSELYVLDHRMAALTRGEVERCSSMPALKRWLTGHGLEQEKLRKEDLATLLEQQHHPDAVRQALLLRAEANKSSVKKFAAIRHAVNADGRLRGMFLSFGAATGRWSGQVVQLQNLVRKQIPADQLETAIQTAFSASRTGSNARLRELARELDLSVMELAGRLLRPCLVAGPDRLLQAGDLEQIEARVLPWLAKADRLLEVYRQGRDPYRAAAAGIFRVDAHAVSPWQRQIGKVAILALGFGGSIGAFNSMGAAYGVHLDEETVQEIVQNWRQANHEIVRFWYGLSDAAIEACNKPGREVGFGRIVMRHLNGHLHMLLPRGRWLTYWKAAVADTPGLDGYMRPTVIYKSAEGRGQLRDVRLWGGKIAENCTQAVASDCLRTGLLNLEQAGLDIVGHVHDEAILEVRQDQAGPINQCMTTMPAWAKGLPVACSVAPPAWRYGKA